MQEKSPLIPTAVLNFEFEKARDKYNEVKCTFTYYMISKKKTKNIKPKYKNLFWFDVCWPKRPSVWNRLYIPGEQNYNIVSETFGEDFFEYTFYVNVPRITGMYRLWGGNINTISAHFISHTYIFFLVRKKKKIRITDSAESLTTNRGKWNGKTKNKAMNGCHLLRVFRFMQAVSPRM